MLGQQVHFNDSTEIMLSSLSRVVMYVNKSLVRSAYLLSALPDDPELLQRLKYAKGVLVKLVSHRT